MFDLWTSVRECRGLTDTADIIFKIPCDGKNPVSVRKNFYTSLFTIQPLRRSTANKWSVAIPVLDGI